MDISQVSRSGLEVAKKMPESAAGKDRLTPPEGDVERFQGAMADLAAKRTGESESLARGAMDGLAKISGQIQTGRTQAIQTLCKSEISQADLLRAQFSLMESSTLVSAVSKTTEKITQGLKTLQQG
ncbi:MAG: EscI/YscI/HrpB family type III secretion system inner rod protein [Planctomycetota bacterium]|jgi:hypothetical protein|nr:EscI/YscI/HrpB family type III secretion system inner rod protein [Planctomycetota bacterium]